MTVDYEWAVESMLTHEDGEVEIDDVAHYESYAQARQDADGHTARGGQAVVALVRDRFDGPHLERAWAYITNNALPETFRDAYDSPTTPTPKRFRMEVAQYHELNHA